MEPTWTDIAIAVSTVAIALAAVLIGAAELIRARRTHRFEKDQVRREWQKDAARLLVSDHSANSSEICITNVSDMPFHQVTIRVSRFVRAADGYVSEPHADIFLKTIPPGRRETVDYNDERVRAPGNPEAFLRLMAAGSSNTRILQLGHGDGSICSSFKCSPRAGVTATKPSTTLSHWSSMGRPRLRKTKRWTAFGRNPVISFC